MRESLARALSGPINLDEQAHERPVDRLHALAAAQRKETYSGEKDAAARAYLASLGVDLIRLKLANVPRAYAPCVERLTVALMWRGKVLRLDDESAPKVAAQCIQEFVVDFCPTCSGRGEVPDKERGDGRDGAVPMKQCPTCNGAGVRRYTDDERREAVEEFRRLDKAFASAHALMSQAVREALWNARKFLRS